MSFRINKNNISDANACDANACAICYEEIQDEYVTECNHKFCKNCITKWFTMRHTCPYCNKEFAYIATEDTSDLKSIEDLFIDFYVKPLRNGIKYFANRYYN